MKHSPGPWVKEWGDADGYPIIAANGEEVAFIAFGEHGANPTEEQEANADLIAVAPELLKVAEDARRYMNRLIGWLREKGQAVAGDTLLLRADLEKVVALAAGAEDKCNRV